MKDWNRKGGDEEKGARWRCWKNLVEYLGERYTSLKDNDVQTCTFCNNLNKATTHQAETPVGPRHFNQKLEVANGIFVFSSLPQQAYISKPALAETNEA